MRELLVAVLERQEVLAAFLAANAVALAVVWRDLRVRNPQVPGLMRLVWLLTAAYSGPLGLAVYWFSGRRQIPRDSVARRAWRSVAHCYSGCGAGEILGLLLAVGILGLGIGATAATTFLCAYLLGFALTVGPLVQDGMSLAQAVRDAFVAETLSISSMEISAIGIDLWLSASAGPGEALFWTSMLVSLSCGLLVAWPVNLWLIARGIKEGMHPPWGGH